MRLKIVLPYHIRDANRVTEAFMRHLEATMAEAPPRTVIVAIERETSEQAARNDADTIFVEALSDPASSEELTFLSIAMVRAHKELRRVHGFTLRTKPMLSVAA